MALTRNCLCRNVESGYRQHRDLYGGGLSIADERTQRVRGSSRGDQGPRASRCYARRAPRIRTEVPSGAARNTNAASLTESEYSRGSRGGREGSGNRGSTAAVKVPDRDSPLPVAWTATPFWSAALAGADRVAEIAALVWTATAAAGHRQNLGADEQSPHHRGPEDDVRDCQRRIPHEFRYRSAPEVL
jgi:hypothetical protein